MALGTLDRTPPPFFRQGPSALTKLCFCSALARLPDGRRHALSPDAADPRHRRRPCSIRCSGRCWCRSRRSPARRAWFAGLTQRHRRRGRGARDAGAPVGAGDARRPAAAGERPAARPARAAARRSACARRRPRCCTRPPIPYSRKVIIDRGVDPRRRPRLAGDQRGRRARPGDAGLPAVVRGHAADRQGRRDSGAQHAQRRAQRRVRRRARRLGRWSCASWPATPTSRSATCCTTSGVDGIYPPGLAVATVADGRSQGRLGLRAHRPASPRPRPTACATCWCSSRPAVQLPPRRPRPAAVGRRRPPRRRRRRRGRRPSRPGGQP